MTMSDRYACCGRRKSWSWNNHAEGCRNAARRSKLAHPTNTAVAVECPAHPGEDRYLCRPCEALSDERREA